jgi:hypothetical protein
VIRSSSQSSQTVLAAVRKRLAEEPDRVLPALQVIADPDAMIEVDDDSTIALARTLNAHRVVAGLREFRAHAYSTDHVREVLGGVSRQAVSQRVRNNRLMSMEISGKSWFPDWQFVDGRPVAGLATVVAALVEAGQDAYTADAVMRTALPEEGGRTPADLLRDGDLERAVHYVRAVGGGF